MVGKTVMQQPRGFALDLACGNGRNARYLAGLGFEVEAFDISDVVIDWLQQRTKEWKLPIQPRSMDLATASLPREKYRVIANFFYLERALFVTIKEALVPGGLLFFETFTKDQLELSTKPIQNKTARIWHCRISVAAMNNAKYYGYVVDGPYDPAAGHRFDAQKVLLDPYAKTVFFPDGFGREAARHPGSNAGQAPLGVINSDQIPFDWGNDRRPHHTFDTIIYELHVKGFTPNTMKPNETTWLNWELVSKNHDVFRFFKNMIAFRKAHPSLGRSRFWREEVHWYGAGEQVDLADHSHSLAFCLHGASQQDDEIYVRNPYTGVVHGIALHDSAKIRSGAMLLSPVITCGWSRV